MLGCIDRKSFFQWIRISILIANADNPRLYITGLILRAGFILHMQISVWLQQIERKKAFILRACRGLLHQCRGLRPDRHGNRLWWISKPLKTLWRRPWQRGIGKRNRFRFFYIKNKNQYIISAATGHMQTKQILIFFYIKNKSQYIISAATGHRQTKQILICFFIKNKNQYRIRRKMVCFRRCWSRVDFAVDDFLYVVYGGEKLKTHKNKQKQKTHKKQVKHKNKQST